MSRRAGQIAEMTRHLLALDFLRFLLVGFLNTIFGYLIYLAILALAMAPEIALAVATSVGAFFNYLTTGRLVFRQQDLHKLLPFLGAYAAIYLVNLLLVRALISVGVTPQWAQGLLLPVVAGTSFLVFKYLVFNDRPALEQAD